MDGAPIRGECIPVRFYMAGIDLTPTYKNVQNKFSVRCFQEADARIPSCGQKGFRTAVFCG